MYIILKINIVIYLNKTIFNEHAAEMCMGKITLDTITSKNNQLIKDTKKLLTSSKHRTSAGAFVLEGARLCFDVLNSVYRPEYLLITEKAAQKYEEKFNQLAAVSKNAFYISEDVAAKLSQTENAQGIFAVCKMHVSQSAVSGKKIIALDHVQDPSNVGAIIRTAEALGIDSLILHNCCDIYNDKVLRASMGSVLRANLVLTADLQKTLEELKHEFRIYSTVPLIGAAKITDIDFTVPSVCVIGNEANGVAENIKSISDALITIPMLGRAESLNAGVAASITMWEMMR